MDRLDLVLVLGSLFLVELFLVEFFLGLGFRCWLGDFLLEPEVF